MAVQQQRMVAPWVHRAEVLLVASAMLCLCLASTARGGIANEISFGLEFNDGAGTTILTGVHRQQRLLLHRLGLLEPKRQALKVSTGMQHY
jgi:hypothetical protein